MPLDHQAGTDTEQPLPEGLRHRPRQQIGQQMLGGVRHGELADRARDNASDPAQRRPAHRAEERHRP
ncbi:hypothetical protein ACFY2R_29980, partial [Micromonospora olivasterospora]|uniref:hypothetical protein n=1 Tax=Micromonospora olivasterospora TaxID=1880 RepID=UPI0036A3E6DE